MSLFDQLVDEALRSLPPPLISETLEQPDFWTFLVNLVVDRCEQVRWEAGG